MTVKVYKVVIAQSGKEDVKGMKKYILDNFKYRELGENFSKKIKKAAMNLNVLPKGYEKTNFSYLGYEIYYKPVDTYLLFFTIDEKRNVVTVLRVLKDGMNWKFILKRWLEDNQ